MADRNRWRTVLATVGASVLLLVVGGLVFIYSGAYSVAASEPHTPLVSWALGTLQERSVAVHADGVAAPPPVDAATLQHGFEHYTQMCVMCHGAPGVERGEVGRGLIPTAPNLSEAATEYTPRELYWILAHGIKMTGMPAFGETHSPEELWGMVAFVRQLPDISPDEYQRMLDSAGLGVSAADSAGRSHAAGTPAHAH